jgi:hypothetical protein
MSDAQAKYAYVTQQYNLHAHEIKILTSVAKYAP